MNTRSITACCSTEFQQLL